MKLLDRGVVGGAERDMGAGIGLALVKMQPQRRFALGAKARAAVVARAQYIAERRQRRGVEAHAGVEIANAQTDMIVHESSPVIERVKGRAGLE